MPSRMPTLFLVSAAFTAGAIATVTAPRFLSAQAETASVATEAPSPALATSASAVTPSVANSPCHHSAWPYTVTDCVAGVVQPGRPVRIISLNRNDNVRQGSGSAPVAPQVPVAVAAKEYETAGATLLPITRPIARAPSDVVVSGGDGSVRTIVMRSAAAIPTMRPDGTLIEPQTLNEPEITHFPETTALADATDDVVPLVAAPAPSPRKRQDVRRTERQLAKVNRSRGERVTSQYAQLRVSSHGAAERLNRRVLEREAYSAPVEAAPSPSNGIRRDSLLGWLTQAN